MFGQGGAGLREIEKVEKVEACETRREELVNVVLSIVDDLISVYPQARMFRNFVADQLRRYVSENEAALYVLMFNIYTKLKRFFSE